MAASSNAADVAARAFELGLDTGKRDTQSLPRSVNADSLPYVVIPKDSQVVPLGNTVYHENREFPTRREGAVTVDDAGSFIEYFQRFCDEDSMIFAKQDSGVVKAILDYHGAGEKQPRWKKHTVTLTLRKTEEWAAWMQQSGVKMSQAEFAEFIEDHIPEFSNPDAASMLEIATTMQASSGATMESAIRLSNGAIKFAWNETVSGKFGSGQTECPEKFTCRMAVYQGMGARQIECRLRYRLSAGKLTMWFDILRSSAIEREAFSSAISEIKQATGQTVLMGAA